MSDARRLCERASVELVLLDMRTKASVPPPYLGVRMLFLSSRVPTAARPFIVLHELAHVLNGDADELEVLLLDETRYPLPDRIADAVAAIGITTPAEREWPAEDLAERLRELVPVDSRAWLKYRSNDVAKLIGSQ